MIDRSEKRWVWIFGGIVALVTTLPYLVAFAVQGSTWRYTGLLIASEDGSSYLAKMLLGSSGDWLFRTPYTAYPQSGFLAFLPYMLLGKLAAGAGRFEQLVALFHLFRISGVLAFTIATYQFISCFIEPRRLRQLGTILAVFGGGLGFLSVFGLGWAWQGVMKMPLEFYSPESFGFLSTMALPHLAWGRALLLWGLIVHLRGNQVRSGLLSGWFWLLLGFMQPLTVVTAWAVQSVHLAGWSIWILKGGNSDWRAWGHGVMRVLFSVLVSAPLVLYNFFAFQIDPFLQRWQLRNLIPSPPIGDYLLAYAIVLPLVVAGGWAWRKSLTVEKLLPISWVVTFPFLAYAPYNLQRRLPEGIWVALCVLALAGLEIMPKRWRTPLRLGLGFAFISSLLLYLGALTGVFRPGIPLFRPYAETQAMDFLSQRAEKNAVVLAAYDTSTVLPSRAPVHVLIGHGPESLDLEKIQPRVAKFFSSGTKSDREGLLSEFSVSYVFYGPLERSLGDWDPGTADFLSEIYRDGDYSIYSVGGLPK